MPFPAVQDVITTDFFTAEDELRKQHPAASVERVLRLRELYNWVISNPDCKDKEFVDVAIGRFGICKTQTCSMDAKP